MDKKEIEIYQKIRNELEEFCENYVNKLYKIDNTLCYPYYDTFDIYDDVLYIDTYSISYGGYETKTKTINVPLQVLYDNKIDEYINELHNENLKKQKEKKKNIYEKERQSAIETINKLKEKFNL